MHRYQHGSEQLRLVRQGLRFDRGLLGRRVHDQLQHGADRVLRRVRGFDERHQSLRHLHHYLLGVRQPGLHEQQLSVHDGPHELHRQL